MGYSSMAAMIGGSMVKAGGSYDSAIAQKDMLNAEGDIADLQARQAILSGQIQEQNSRLASGALYGRERAQLGANGVQLGSGSALDLLASTKYLGDRDAATIHDNALRTAWGYKTQAAFDRSGAGAISPGFTAFTSLLGSAGTVASSWYSLNKAGAFGN